MLAERLLAALADEGFDLRLLAIRKAHHQGPGPDALPNHAGSLRRLLPRLVDLHRIVQRHYYHPDFRGSFSLKAVLPALTKAHYDDLAIADGRLAAVRYMQALAADDAALRRDMFEQLRAYCEREHRSHPSRARCLEGSRGPWSVCYGRSRRVKGGRQHHDRTHPLRQHGPHEHAHNFRRSGTWLDAPGQGPTPCSRRCSNSA